MSSRRYSPKTSKYICLDYDGTLVEDNFFPSLAPFKHHAIKTIIAMQKEGYEIHIWTARPPSQFEAILNQINEAGIDTTHIKVNEPFSYFLGRYEEMSTKVYCDVYIDDRAYGIDEINWKDIAVSFLGTSLNY